MKLLVIVLCLLSERFLVHVSSHHRFHWFGMYANAMEQRLSQIAYLSTPWLLLLFAVLPLCLLALVVLYLFSNWVFGFVGLLLNIAIFYYCMGPDNPFYPKRGSTDDSVDHDDIGKYLSEMNGQLFAIIFWYIFLGPLAVLLYRLIWLCKYQSVVRTEASWLIQLLDWLPVRMTALLFLLVGNFQAGFKSFTNYFLSNPSKNDVLLMSCGLQALQGQEDGAIHLPQAENMVEHAIIVLLVLLACFTLVAWM